MQIHESNENHLPGGIFFENELLTAFRQKAEDRGEKYTPRTQHFSSDGQARYTNRLFLESSPYLLQHAHNPVNWYPWGDEAFEAARRLDRPVLVSIGYSTCHWCHVMEEESFEDPEIAAFLNSHFISIKVDREERPDVDAIYMAAVQVLNGSGGWPLNVLLMPDKKPFWGGTYFPARDGDRGASMGFLSILNRIHEVFTAQQDQLAQTSDQLTDAIRSILVPEPAGGGEPSAALLDQAATYYRNQYDRINGGLSGAPKFPSSLPLRFLLRYYQRTGQAEFLQMAEQTLEKMAAGGMYDQAGGGFHRYSVDAGWQVPHFEKMLYDNALLATAYLEAYQITGKNRYRRIVEEILRYIGRDMTSPEGAFYSATDADSLTPGGKREEGYFFTWKREELEQVLGPDKADIAIEFYNVEPAGNFEGRSILNRSSEPDEEYTDVVAEINEKLYRARMIRPAPIRDEKILTAWNGLMISAFTKAGWVLKHDGYLQAAIKAAGFILENMLVGGRLLRSFNDARASLPAYLEDYAFFTAALLDLYEATGNDDWFRRAVELDHVLKVHFEDETAGGFFATGDDHDALIAREKPNYDGATPSGNSIALLNLLRLGELTGEGSYNERFQKAYRLFLGSSDRNPVALSEMLLAVDFFEGRPLEIVIIEPENRPGSAEPFLDILRERFLPNRVLAVATEGDDGMPIVQGRTATDGKATAYVCQAGACRSPVTDIDPFIQELEQG